MSINISKKKREELLQEIESLKRYVSTSPQDKNTSNLLKYIADIEREINKKKYGLVFEEHEEDVDVKLRENAPILCDQRDLYIDKNGEINFLLEGDNLTSLYLLEKTHKSKVDFIYIDPPYNTGNKDFIYDDAFVDETDLFKHSKWLSFMAKRLSVMKKLLSPSGVICISIDDNEVAQLKLLMDDIFGANNFIAQITREAIRGGSKSKFIRKCTDYVLVYAYNVDNVEFSGYKQLAAELNMEDEHGMYLRGRELNKWGAGSRREDAPTMWFPIKGPNGEDVYPIRNDGSEGRWRLGKKKMLEKAASGDIIFEPRQDGTYICYEKIRKTEDKIKQFTTLFSEKYLNAKGGDRIKKLFGTMMSVFDYAKPVELIYDLILMACPNDNSIILDAFAGSGTTGEAVLQFNRDFDKHNKFILCTNNQNNICREITYERIKKVIDQDEYCASLKYMKVGYIPINEKLYYEYADELLKHVKELVELENGVDFNNDKRIAILLTEEEVDLFERNMPDECEIIYLGHDILLSNTQVRLFKNKNIIVNTIPDYYYRDLEE